MRVTEHKDGHAVRLVLTGLIVSPEVLARIAPKWTPNCLGSKWADLVGGWAVDFYLTKKRPPMQYIEDCFRRWEETKGHDKDAVQLVSQFLASLSDQHVRERKKLNPDHVVEVAARHMKGVRLKALRDQIDADLEHGNVDEADQVARGYTPVEIGKSAVTKFGPESVPEIFEKKLKPLITYPGKLGAMLNPAMIRGSLVGLFGKEKSGKSMWLMEILWRAIRRHGLRVALFETGDMTPAEWDARFLVRVMKRPLTAGSYPVPIRIVSVSVKEGVGVESREEAHADDVTQEEATAAAATWSKKYGDLLRRSFHTNNSLTVPAMRSQMDEWVRSDWIPDVVVVDYADLLVPVNTKQDYRHQRNDVWKGLRALSRDYSVLTVTASQVNREAYGSPVIRMEHASEDKRVWGDLSYGFGLNRTDGEVVDGSYRLNTIVGRNGFDPGQVVGVAGCLYLAKPFLMVESRRES